jgi:predicted secreted hydrolase
MMFARSLVFILLAALQITGLTAHWRQASPEYRLVFPRDHASHPAYKIEWWYYTGNLRGDGGHGFGYQVTFFRVGVDPAPANPSRWAVRDLFMAHLAITDIDGRRHRFAEHLNRAGPGWAGADTETLHVWNDTWEARLDNHGRHLLRARDETIRVDLVLEEGKPPVLHGARGYSRKGAEPGNASIYYSLTRMPTRGEIVFEGRTYHVEGLSWMDHEFGTSFLEETQTGWDWFSVQLDDQSEIMLFQIRDSDGRRDPRSGGTYVDSRGRTQAIGLSQFDIKPLSRWKSPSSGAEYPIEWQVEVPALGLDLTVRAAVAGQELSTDQSSGVIYWEGATAISGTSRGRAVRGKGYLEMTGYAGGSMGRLLR